MINNQSNLMPKAFWGLTGWDFIGYSGLVILIFINCGFKRYRKTIIWNVG